MFRRPLKPTPLYSSAASDVYKRQPGTFLTDRKNRTGDIFNDTHPYTNWRSGVEHAAKLGVGSLEYELIEVR